MVTISEGQDGRVRQVSAGNSQLTIGNWVDGKLTDGYGSANLDERLGTDKPVHGSNNRDFYPIHTDLLDYELRV